MVQRRQRVVATVLVHDAGVSLGRVLQGLAVQTRAPDRIIVLDNGSREEQKPEIAPGQAVTWVRSSENLGVGGGHGQLFRMALSDPTATHVWCLEHDSYATPSCLCMLLEAEARLLSLQVKVGALMARLERNEEEAAERPLSSEPWHIEPRFTFNGVLFARRAIEEAGLPRSDFFFGIEDWEYSQRLNALGFQAYEVHDALMFHPTKGNHRFHARPDVVRSYYTTRNWMRFRIEERPALGPITSCAWSAASLGAILVRDDHKLRRIVARVTATRDALSNRMGPRSYWFLEP